MIKLKLYKCIFLASFTSLITLINPVAQAKSSHFDQKTVRRSISAFMERNQIPGAAVAILDHGKSHVYVFGVANTDTKKPITTQTLFEIGSLTQLFTTLLFSEEIAQNQLKIEDKLTHYIPLLSDNDSLNQVTLEELATYTASLPFGASSSIQTEVQLEDYLMTWQPVHRIGTVWQYSNLSIALLGKVLQVQNQDYIEKLYQQAIFSPLKMKSTTVTLPPEVKQKLAQGYNHEGKPVQAAAAGLFPAASAGKSNIDDLSLFLAAAASTSNTPQTIQAAMQIAQTPRVNLGNIEQAFSWQLTALNDPHLLKAPENMAMKMAPVKWLSTEKQRYNPNMLVDKTGATNGFRAYIAVVPSQQSGIVILTNKYVSNGAIVNEGREILNNYL